MINYLNKYFKIDEYGSTISREIIAGMTTFATMAYIIVVNPKILEAAGIPFGPSMVATIISAFFGTMAMGLYAKRPFAVAPYMGENAFIAFTVVKVMGYSWQTAIGAIFIGGVLFVIFTTTGIRSWMISAIPKNLKNAFVVGIGLFLTFIGLNTTGIVTIGVPGAPIHLGNLSNPSTLLAIGCFFLMAMLMAKKISGAIIIGIIATTIAAFFLKIAQPPTEYFSMPPSLEPTFLQLDITGSFTWGFISVILTVFILDFLDTMGTLYAVSYRAGLLDKNGDLPQIEKPLLVDALTTVLASLLGTTTTGVFVESATGIEAGGRTGLTAVTTAMLFLAALFLEPVLTTIPPCAYGPSLIIVGMLMIAPCKNLEVDDISELVPAFLVIALMSFTYNLGTGMTAGFIAYPFMKTVTGKIREISAGLWMLCFLSVLFFLTCPH
ncbi:NCS2 family permease [Maridesulfovibrio ferrireducens]|uniref:NCS2 family permease n=1 Tax=Maridesulfovibrio ferrireducens TaxID=246191 RepID=UPI001A291E1A|nr:NCS2 family permease [Maridesulfovibrio ferrireducens]MBI9110440.1 NCS2 family permease [Maridesulfovibrio ferrireducens]